MFRPASKLHSIPHTQSLFSFNTSTKHPLGIKRSYTTSSSQLPLFTPENTKLGWIGTGVMGRWMCHHLIEKGYQCTVFSRTASKTEPLVKMGATRVNSPKEVAENSDVVISMVGYPKDVKSVLLGESGVINGLRKGGVMIDMTTSKPSLAEEIYEEAEKKGIHSVDAPVSGGDVGAKNAALSIMVGGNEDVFKALRPIFETMGKTIRHMGGAGTGQHTKMANQVFIASGMIGVVEGLLYAYKSGLDPEQVIQAVESGAAGSFSLSNYGPRILKRNFEPGFYVDHFVKDMEIALEECKRMNLVMPGLTTAKMLYDSLKAHGGGDKGTHALMLALEKVNNMEMDKK